MVTTTSKIWETGRGLVITVPKEVRVLMNIKKGNYVVVDWNELIVLEKNVSKEDHELKEELPEL